MTKEELKAEVKNSRPEHVAKSTWSAFVEKVIDRAWPHIDVALDEAGRRVYGRFPKHAGVEKQLMKELKELKR